MHGKWVVHFFPVESSILQAKLSVVISVLIFTPIYCMYLEGISYCSSYFCITANNNLFNWICNFQYANKQQALQEKQKIRAEIRLLIQPPFLLECSLYESSAPKLSVHSSHINVKRQQVSGATYMCLQPALAVCVWH